MRYIRAPVKGRPTGRLASALDGHYRQAWTSADARGASGLITPVCHNRRAYHATRIANRQRVGLIAVKGKIRRADARQRASDSEPMATTPRAKRRDGMMGAPTTRNNATSQLRAHPSGARQEEWPTATRSRESQPPTRREGTRAGQCAGDRARRASNCAEIRQQLARPRRVLRADAPL